MKIVLLGKNGQVGHELQRTLLPLGQVIALGREEADLSVLTQLQGVLAQHTPDIIVNAAAYSAVDKAESDEATAFCINAEAVGLMAEHARQSGALLVHYSTDYVFDGENPAPYVETDATNPQSAYGRSKRAGEQAIEQSGCRALIFRTSWVFSVHGSNFIKTILRLAKERENLNVVADQYGAPTSAALVADVTAQLVRQKQREGGENFPFGLYHLVPGGETNWCSYARFVVSEALAVGKPLKLSPDSICAITSSEYPTPAKRPANSRLDTSKLRGLFGLELPNWQSGVRHILQQILGES